MQPPPTWDARDRATAVAWERFVAESDGGDAGVHPEIFSPCVGVATITRSTGASHALLRPTTTAITHSRLTRW
jgi:hypothetical protein